MGGERIWNGSCNFGPINTKPEELPFSKLCSLKMETFILLEWVILNQIFFVCVSAVWNQMTYFRVECCILRWANNLNNFKKLILTVESFVCVAL